MITAVIGAGVLALALAGCGTQTASKQQSALSTAPASPGQAAPAATTAPASGPVGMTFDVTDTSGTDISVTLVRQVDPAQGTDEFNTPSAGFRLVGEVFTIKANASYSDDANNDAAVTGSDGQTYTPDFTSITGYTNFDSGDVKLATGESATGAVVFQVPAGVQVAKVTYDVSSGFGSGPVPEWIPGQ